MRSQNFENDNEVVIIYMYTGEMITSGPKFVLVYSLLLLSIYVFRYFCRAPLHNKVISRHCMQKFKFTKLNIIQNESKLYSRSV